MKEGVYVLLLVLLLIAAMEDIHYGRVSNRLIVIGLGVGFCVQLYQYSIVGIFIFIWNVCVPIILFFLLFLMRVLGAGDIKLFSMIGSMLTVRDIGWIILFSFLWGGVIAFVILFRAEHKWKRLKGNFLYLWNCVVQRKAISYEPPEDEEILYMPFAVPILLGMVTFLVF